MSSSFPFLFFFFTNFFFLFLRLFSYPIPPFEMILLNTFMCVFPIYYGPSLSLSLFSLY